jgi:L-alanine-DL-glutamate epimerase-like enolase superfamily enzyme
MLIKSITLAKLQIPLIRPFITAVRQTSYVEDIVVMLHTDCGKIGYGSAAATPAITGETGESIIAAIQNIIAPKLIGQNINEFNKLLNLVQNALQKNNSAKAAVDIALHDLFAQLCNLPLYRLLGGATNQLETCITISAKDIPEMAHDAKLLITEGFTTLKLKVGLTPCNDIQRITAIRHTVGDNIKIIIDANQGWQTKNALHIINKLEQNNLNIQLIEQPVKAHDLNGLKYIHDHTNSMIFADEACFSPYDAFIIAKDNISDGINIKLMKCGGIHNANAIYNIASTAQIHCMVGCMLESPIGIAAIASFASAKPDILFADFDPIALIKSNPIKGGAQLVQNKVILSENPGLGIEGVVDGLTIICEVK